MGIAIDPEAPTFGSQDVLYIDSAIWAPEAQAYGEQAQKKYGFLTSMTRFVTLTTEYPPWGEPVMTVDLPPVAPRRQPCPCGSGKRFKNCHGRAKQGPAH